MSYITNGKTDILAAQKKTTSWIKTSGTPNKIRVSGYVKNGTNGNSHLSYDDLPFSAPTAVNAMWRETGGSREVIVVRHIRLFWHSSRMPSATLIPGTCIRRRSASN